MRKIRAIACEAERLFKESENYKTCEPYMEQVIGVLERQVKRRGVKDDYVVEIIPSSDVYDVVRDNLARTFLCTCGLRCKVSSAPSSDLYRIIRVTISFDDLISILY